MSRRRYTEHDLRNAIADPTVHTMADLCRALGLVPRGANYETVRAYATTLGIDLDAALPGRRAADVRGRSRNQPSYTDEQLLAALQLSHVDGYRALCATLGLRPLSATYRRLRERADAMGHPIPSAWSRRGPASAAAWPPREEVLAAVREARSLADAIRALGREPSGSYRWIKAVLAHHDVDTSHFTPYRRTNPGRPRRPLSELLVADRPTNSVRLRQRLIDEGLRQHRCESCGLEEWNGRPIPLELDHIDGDRRNNLLTNLRLLCPNCHAQTPTYRGRNIRNGSRRRDEQD